jgi:hypothetical protein
MKKRLLTTIVILTSLIIFSFKTTTDNEEIIITVSADKQTTFDMFQDSKTVKGLKTPYQIKLKSDESRFIFKSKNPKTSLKIEAKKKGAKLSATWPITVLLIDGDKLTTFGID